MYMYICKYIHIHIYTYIYIPYIYICIHKSAGFVESTDQRDHEENEKYLQLKRKKISEMSKPSTRKNSFTSKSRLAGKIGIRIFS
jgi:hypothetical protein